MHTMIEGNSAKKQDKNVATTEIDRNKKDLDVLKYVRIYQVCAPKYSQTYI